MLLTLLRFLRLPLVFSALADPIAGCMLMREPGQDLPWRSLLLLSAASACFYTAGMVFNDIRDVGRDRKIHPHRPLPTGEIPLGAAWGIGLVLMGAGLDLAHAISSLAFQTGLLLAGAVFLYDFLLKEWVVPGAVSLGAARALNLALGAAAIPVAGSRPMRIWDYFVMSGTYTLPSGRVIPAYVHGAAGQPLWNYLLIQGTYIAVVTWISTMEEPPATRSSFAAGAASLILVVLFSNALILPTAFEPWIAVGLTLLLAGMILSVGISVGRRFTTGRVFHMTRTGVMGVITLDAALVAGRGHPGEGAMLLALYIPALLMGRVLGKL